MSRELTYPQALNEALHEEMEKDPDMCILGQDIGVLGGVWGMTKGLKEKFGSERVIESPICEASMLGIGLGASLNNVKMIIDVQRIDFLMLSMSMLVNEIAKMHYLTNGRVCVQLIIHSLTGALGIAGPQHSQALESLFSHIPGLKVVLPSSAYEAKGLMKSAIHDNNPILFFDHVRLNLTKSFIPEKEYYLPIHQLNIVRKGEDLTIVSNAYMLHRIKELLSTIEEKKYDIELIDVRCIAPIDMCPIVASVQKTGKLLVVHDPCKIGGYGEHIISYMVEKHFSLFKKAPVCLGAKHYPIPHNANMAKQVLVSDEDIMKTIESMLIEKVNHAEEFFTV